MINLEIVLIVGAFVISFILVLLTIRSILEVASVRNLYDEPNIRKIHNSKVCAFGGVAIFMSFIVTTIVATDGYSFDSLKYIIAAVILMFFIGLKDDLLLGSVKNKLVVQLFAAVLLITLGNIRFTSFQGLFQIYEIDYFTSVLFSAFVIVVIINVYNLVDEIDGLASGLAMMSASVFGIWFYLLGQIQFSIMSFALVGSLGGFSLFNVFWKSKKLFMGDSGSLIMGLIISTLTIKFNEFNIVKSSAFSIANAPAVSLAILVIPLIDTIRVMTFRLWLKKSPFSPDKRHLHHSLLRLVPNHLKVSIIILMNGLLIGSVLFFNLFSLNVNVQFIAILLFGFSFSLIPFYVIYRSSQRFRKVENPENSKQ